VKAKYEEEDWLDIAGDLSDKIRENQKQALISYLLMQPAIQAWGAEDADGLFEYFLIDVQMGACMDSSRIVQANAAIQMFVNRCLLNQEKGVSPGAIDKDRWEWMKNYRVWEANRKVFLYPENWLEPEWRNNRSEFFKELESYLVQNDITERSVEQGFRNYLTSLNEVANLEVCGMYQENYDDAKLKNLHVFARTHNAPYKFFYRTWNEHWKWSAWGKVQVDIRSVEDGDNSGVHLIPMVWKKRLFLFWPEFMEVPEAPYDSNQSVESLASEPNKVSGLEPVKYWEIRLAWSEYVDGKWTPKQVTKEFIKLPLGDYIPGESSTRFSTNIDSDNKLYIPGESSTRFSANIDSDNKLIIHFVAGDSDNAKWILEGYFKLSDIASKVKAETLTHGMSDQWYATYSISFMSLAGCSKLTLLNDVYLNFEIDHKLLLSSATKNYKPTFDEPFFFSDTDRTYFVRPVDILIFNCLKYIEHYKPYIPPKTYEYEEHVIPDFGPDDYMPVSRAVMMRSGNPTTGVTSARRSASKNYGMETKHVEAAFGADIGVGPVDWKHWLPYRYAKGLEFHTFYHPFSSKYVTNLNQGGLPRP
jgi:hypothetical protein